MGDSGPSAPLTSAIGNNYYVFLSYSHPDTRKGFTDHLHRRLVNVGLPFHPNFVFRDNDDLPMGELFSDGLLSAIGHSKVSIPVISEHYAGSKWCLRELITIMKCRKNRGQIVLPVLYKVKASDVRNMEGPFGAAFHSNTRFSDEFKKEAKEALQETLKLQVYISDVDYSGHDGKLVEELVETVRCHLQRGSPAYIPVDLVGFDAHVTKVMNLADVAFLETRIIVIHGIGGVGKTALVTTIYDKLFDKFQWHSFLKDIRETIQIKDMQYVQSLLVSDLTKSSERLVRHSEIGRGNIEQAAEGKKILVVLDDVDCQDHLDKLISVCNCGSGSRIFITCRDKTLFKSEYKEHELQKLNPTDSLFLFNRHAFGMKQPSEELAALSIKIADTTGGLPLALVIVGSLLKDKDISIWMEMLEKLKKVPHEDVQKVLRISYDSLGYEEQQMFLDIACFFIGIDKRIAAYLWDNLEYFPPIGLKVLINRSLIIDDDSNELRMHDHLRDLGRAIARPAHKKLWKCSRLWDEEAITVQRGKLDNRYVEALSLNQKGSSMFTKKKSYERMPYLKFLRLSEVDFVGDFEDSLSELRWLEWEKCPDSFVATNVDLEKLLILNLSDGSITENWGGWTSIKMGKLKVLSLSRCSHLKSTPDLSALKNLERLILKNCANLEAIGDSIGDLKCLVSLDLRDCGKLGKLPNHKLGELENLEELLVDRTGITEFPDCIQSLKKLKTLSAVGCGQLTVVPSKLGEVKGLVSLNLEACRKLQVLPGEMCKLEELKELIIRMTAIEKLPADIGNLKKLEMLDASGCESLDGLPDSIGRLVNLLTLNLERCYKLDKLPKSIGSLVKLQRLLLANPPPKDNGDASLLLANPPRPPKDNGDAPVEKHIPDSIGWLEWLTKLDLSWRDISELPESIGDLKSLKTLQIFCCVNLTTLPSTIHKLGKLEELHASMCEKLGGEIRIDGMSSLRILDLSWTSVSGFPDAMDKLSRLEKLDLRGCMMLRSLPQSIGKMPSLQHLDLTYCEELWSLPELPVSLAVLKVTCQHRTLPRLSHLMHLKELAVEDCGSLESMPELPSGLLMLRADSCGKLEELPSLSSLGYLSELYLKGCNGLTKIEGLEALRSLEELYVSGWRKLSDLEGLERLESLRRLTIDFRQSDAPLWNDDLSLVRLKNLEVLKIRGCRSLRSLDLSKSATHLKRLSTRCCSNLVEIKGLLSLTNLESWNNHDCTSLDIPDRSCFPKIKESRWGDWKKRAGELSRIQLQGPTCPHLSNFQR